MRMCPVCSQINDDSLSVCPACGFHFVGSTEQFGRIKVGDVHGAATAMDAHTARLRVVNGPQVHSVHVLKGEKTTIGRNPSCDVLLNDMTVSRVHATVTVEGGDYYINDDDSFNGTWVNNCVVDKKKLVTGDLIQLGKFCLVFEIE